METCLVKPWTDTGGRESVHFMKLLIMYSLSGPNTPKRVMSENSSTDDCQGACRMPCGEGQLPRLLGSAGFT